MGLVAVAFVLIFPAASMTKPTLERVEHALRGGGDGGGSGDGSGGGGLPGVIVDSQAFVLFFKYLPTLAVLRAPRCGVA